MKPEPHLNPKTLEGEPSLPLSEKTENSDKGLPTMAESEARITDKTFTPLHRFLWEYEPTLPGEKQEFRDRLLAAINSYYDKIYVVVGLLHYPGATICNVETYLTEAQAEARSEALEKSGAGEVEVFTSPIGVESIPS